MPGMVPLQPMPESMTNVSFSSLVKFYMPAKMFAPTRNLFQSAGPVKGPNSFSAPHVFQASASVIPDSLQKLVTRGMFLARTSSLLTSIFTKLTGSPASSLTTSLKDFLYKAKAMQTVFSGDFYLASLT